MEVYVDGRLQESEGLSGREIPEIIREISSGLQGSIVDTVTADGSEIDPDDPQEGPAAEQVAELRVKTRPVRDVVLEALGELREYLPKLKRGLVETARLFAEEREGDGHSYLGSCLEGLQWSLTVLSYTATLCRDEISKMKFSNLNDEIGGTLQELNGAMQNRRGAEIVKIAEGRLGEHVEEMCELAEGLSKVFSDEAGNG